MVTMSELVMTAAGNVEVEARVEERDGGLVEVVEANGELVRERPVSAASDEELRRVAREVARRCMVVQLQQGDGDRRVTAVAHPVRDGVRVLVTVSRWEGGAWVQGEPWYSDTLDELAPGELRALAAEALD